MQLFTSQWDLGRMWLGVCECYWLTDSVIMSSDRGAETGFRTGKVEFMEKQNQWRQKVTPSYIMHI